MESVIRYHKSFLSRTSSLERHMLGFLSKYFSNDLAIAEPMPVLATAFCMRIMVAVGITFSVRVLLVLALLVLLMLLLLLLLLLLLQPVGIYLLGN